MTESRLVKKLFDHLTPSKLFSESSFSERKRNFKAWKHSSHFHKEATVTTPEAVVVAKWLERQSRNLESRVRTHLEPELFPLLLSTAECTKSGP